MALNIAVQMDPIERINVRGDSTFALLLEAQARGHALSYYTPDRMAMARDGVFLRSVGRLHPRSQVPVVAIALQGVVAEVIALSGRYEQILNYVVSVDFIFFGVTAATLFVFRRREPAAARYRVPGHPWTTGLFVVTCLLVVASTVARYPANTAVGLGILLTGVPVYLFWRRRTSR